MNKKTIIRYNKIPINNMGNCGDHFCDTKMETTKWSSTRRK